MAAPAGEAAKSIAKEEKCIDRVVVSRSACVYTGCAVAGSQMTASNERTANLGTAMNRLNCEGGRESHVTAPAKRP